MSYVTLNDMQCIVQPIPNDGNCLFGAAAHQLFNFNVNTAIHRAMVNTLREMVVSFLRANIRSLNFTEVIKLRVQEEYPMLLEENEEITALNFLQLLQEDGTYGGPESLLAIATIFECDIEIYRERGYHTTVTIEGAQHSSRIGLVFRGSVDAWNHYDSLLQLVNDTPSHVNDTHSRYETPLDVTPDGNRLLSNATHQLYELEIASPQRMTSEPSPSND